MCIIYSSIISNINTRCLQKSVNYYVGNTISPLWTIRINFWWFNLNLWTRNFNINDSFCKFIRSSVRIGWLIGFNVWICKFQLSLKRVWKFNSNDKAIDSLTELEQCSHLDHDFSDSWFQSSLLDFYVRLDALWEVFGSLARCSSDNVSPQAQVGFVCSHLDASTPMRRSDSISFLCKWLPPSGDLF
jgi:hypothetical protein